MSDTKEDRDAGMFTLTEHHHCEACGAVLYQCGRLCHKCRNMDERNITALGRRETPRERLNAQGHTIGEIRREIGNLRGQHDKRLHELEILARRMEDALIRASVGGKP